MSQGAKHDISENATESFISFLGPVTSHSVESYSIGSLWRCRLGPLEVRLSLSLEEIRSQCNWAPGMRCPSPAWSSKLVWQICPIASAAIENTFYRPFWVNVGGDCSHRSRTPWAAWRLLRCEQFWSSVDRCETKGVSHDPGCSATGDLYDATVGIVWPAELFSLRNNVSLSMGFGSRLDVVEGVWTA